MKFGILGGTFDPPHLGHLELAKAAQSHLNLDVVMFVPANKNPLKSKKICHARTSSSKNGGGHAGRRAEDAGFGC